MVGDRVREEQIEVDGDASNAGRNVNVNGGNVVRIARPHQGLFGAMDLNGGHLFERTRWPVFAGNPFWIRERERAWLHRQFLVHKRDTARGLRFIDDERHRRLRSALRP